MAIRLTKTSSEYLSASASIDYRAAYTLMGWFYLVTDTNDYNHFLQIWRVDNACQDLGTGADGKE